MKIKLQHVHFMPKTLEPGILYVSKEFCTAAHLCACGCGSKIRTPLGPTEWSVNETENGPTLRPSIGNWQIACRSHYIIKKGEVLWCGDWTSKGIEAGRRNEEKRRSAYYEKISSQNVGFFKRLWLFVSKFFRK